MRTLRAAVAALRYFFDLSRIVWLSRVCTTCIATTAMVFGASFATVVSNLPEGSWLPESSVAQASPLSAYAQWTAAVSDDDDEDFWSGCIADADCVNRICSVDPDLDDTPAETPEKFAGIR